LNKIFSILLFFILSCSGASSKNDFLENKEKYDELYKILVNYNFEVITFETVNELSKLSVVQQKLIQSYMQELDINKIEKLEKGIYFIRGSSALGSDGYFRSNVPRESLEYYTILTPITGNWYSWYQD